MKLIRKTDIKKNKNGNMVSYAIFWCNDCKQEVERTLSCGVKQESCGCIHNKDKKNPNYKHGLTNTRLFNVWKGILQRIFYTKAAHYKDYGGRGITICNEWLEFIPFRDWSLTNGYEEGLQINRIENDGNYEPTNCNFITNEKNQRNRRNNVVTMQIANEIRELYKTDKYTQKELAIRYNISQTTVNYIINNKIWK